MITSILINWQRPALLELVIESIRAQTVPSKIWVWDNSGTFQGHADFVIKSSKNINCLGRWLMSGMVNTKYTFTIDDDMVILDKQYLEKLISWSEQYPDSILGYNANVAGNDPERPYWCGTRVADDKEYDQINTGVSFWPTILINQLPLNLNIDHSEIELKYADDIVVSHYFENKRCAPWIYQGIKAIDEDQHGLSKQSEHMPARDKAYKRLIL
jgi:hypothetical protein